MKKYDSYKDSGVDWIGEIPKHWEIVPLKYVSDNFDSKRVPLNSSERAEIIGEYPYYGATGIVGYINNFLFDGEFVLIGEDGAPFFIQGKDVAFIASGKFWVNNHAHILKPNEKILSNLFCHQLNCVDYKNYITGSTRDKLTQDQLKSIKLLLPSIEEQTTIANFLDHKTTQIDDLIANKGRLIQLLEEERKAVIDDAVTKGIDKNVALKDTGIEWLGEIPNGWHIIRLKFLSRIRYGLGQPPKQKDNGLPIIRATNIFRGIISSANMIYVDPDDLPMNREPILKENDILIVRSGAYTADSAIVTKEWEGSVTGYDIVLTPLKIHPQFLAYCLLSTYLLDNQLFLERLRAAQPHLNSEEIGNSFILLPSDEEQERIVYHIEKQLKKINILKERVLSEIEYLKEYKTALISEVVTGKVDVRNEILN